MHRRSLLRSLATLIPLGLAGCGEYSSDSGTPPEEDAGQESDGTSRTEAAPVDPDVFEVTYSRRHYESDGEAVAEVTVENTAEQRSRSLLVVHFSVDEESETASREIEVDGEDTASFRIPLDEPVEVVELEEFTFETPE